MSNSKEAVVLYVVMCCVGIERRGTMVSVVTRLLGGRSTNRGSISSRGKNIFYSPNCQLRDPPTNPSEWVAGSFITVVNRLEREAGSSSVSSPEAKTCGAVF